MHKIKEKLMNALYEYEEKAKKTPNGKLSAGELQEIHMLTDTVKNICKIEMLDEEMEEEESSYAGGSSYARGRGRGRGRNARRDSMGRYSREGGSSYEEGYSEEGGYRGGSSYEGGNMRGNMGGNMGGRSSYARGEQGGQGGSSRRGGGYSSGGAKGYMIDRLEEMMSEAESEQERRAIHRCMQEIENA